MKQKSWLRTAAFVLGYAPLLAQAALIDIVVTGTVYSSYDKTGNIFGYGTGNGADGQITILKFTCDTTNAPGEYNGGADPYYAAYYDGTDWIESSTSVGGNAVSNVVVNSNNSYYSYVWLNDYLPNYGSVDEIGAVDYDYGYDSGNDGNGNPFYHYGQSQNHFYFGDYIENFLNGVTLEQTFSLVADGSNSYSYGTIFRYRYDYKCLDADCDDEIESYEYAYAYFNIKTITMSPRNAAIPEPGSLALLSLGLSGLAFVRRRKAVAC